MSEVEHMTGNEAMLLAFGHEKDGAFDRAISYYNKALDFYLYKMGWPVTNWTVRKVMEARSRCYRAKAGDRS